MEGNETVKEALRREVKEETNLVIKDIEFVDMDEDEQEVTFPEGFKKKWQLIFLHFKANVKGGKLKAGDDAREVRWVEREEIENQELSEITKSLLSKV